MAHTYELMMVWRRTKDKKGGLKDDFDAELPGCGDVDGVDSDSVTLGGPMHIVKYILKEDLKDYKLVKRRRKK